MSSSKRAARRGAVAVSALALASLTTSMGATALAAPDPDPGLMGTWVNVHPKGALVSRVIVDQTDGGPMTVDPVLRCGTIGGCEIGSAPATLFGTSVASSTGGTFASSMSVGFFQTVELGRLRTVPSTGGPQLVVTELYMFGGVSSVRNFVRTEHFAPGPAATSTRQASPVTSPMTGNEPPADPALVGTWRNTNPRTGGIRQIVVTTADDGSLQAHAYGACGPGLCDWGAVTAPTYGANPSATTADSFLAQYDSGFKTEPLLATLSPRSDVLTVHEYNVWTQNDSPSNYAQSETFKRAPAL